MAEMTPRRRAMAQAASPPRVCPECQHVFQGNGWDGIDAHWKAKHQAIMPYKEGVAAHPGGHLHGSEAMTARAKKGTAADPEQSARFIEAARELGCDESPDAFEAAVKKVARHKPMDETPVTVPQSTKITKQQP